MAIRLIALALILAPIMGGCAAVAVTGAVVGGTAKLATTAVGATVNTTTAAVDFVVPDGDDDDED